MSLATVPPCAGSSPVLHSSAGANYDAPLQDSIVLVRLLQFLLEAENDEAVLRRAVTGMGLLPEVVWVELDGQQSGDLVLDLGDGPSEHRMTVRLAEPNSGAARAAISATLSLVAQVYGQKLEMQRLGAEAATDALTGLWNRRGFDPLVDQALARTTRSGEQIALILIDVDHFKSINDKLGHAAGDRALVAVADAIRSELRPTDVVARLGGDELAVLLAGSDAEGAILVCDRIRAALERVNPLAPQSLTLSMGAADASVVDGPKDHPGREQLFAAADAALYAAKQAGRNRAMAHPSVEERARSANHRGPTIRLVHS